MTTTKFKERRHPTSKRITNHVNSIFGDEHLYFEITIRDAQQTILLTFYRYLYMKIYHGTNTIVSKPEIRQVGYNKDFGFGFYCTHIEKQAQRWALTKRIPHIVCIYEYVPDERLSTKTFLEMSDEWLDFIASCRNGVPHSYDIVEGPMADDEVWDYVEDFLNGRISRDAFWALAKFKRPTHQILFCTEKALKTLQFISHYQL